MINKFDPTIPAQDSRLQSSPIRNNFAALNSRTDQLSPSATIPVSATVIIGPADKIYFEDNRYLPFAGGSINLGSTTTGVSPFIVPGNFKEVIVFYQNSAGTGILGFIESTEKTTAVRNTPDLINNPSSQVISSTGNINTGENLLEGKIVICSILVSNSGTANQRGQINQFSNTDIVDLRPYMQRGGGQERLNSHINETSLLAAHPSAVINNGLIEVLSTSVSQNILFGEKEILIPLGDISLKNFVAGQTIRIPTTPVSSVQLVDSSTQFITSNIVSLTPNVGGFDQLVVDRPLPVIPAGRLVIKGSLTIDRMSFEVAKILEEVTKQTFIRTSLNMSNETEYKLGLGLVVNENVSASAAIEGTKIDPDFGAQNVETTGSFIGSDIQAQTLTITANSDFLDYVEMTNNSSTEKTLQIRNLNPTGSIIEFKGTTAGSLSFRVANDLSTITNNIWTLPSNEPTEGGILSVQQLLGGVATLTWTTPSLQYIYNNSSPSTITTNNTIGNLLITGTQSVDIEATGGLRVGGTPGSKTLVNLNGSVLIQNNTQSTNATTGALVITGGVGVGANLNISGIATALNVTEASSTTVGSLLTSGGLGVVKSARIGLDCYIGGRLYTGSSVIPLTDPSGKILSSSLNTVQVPQGGTGVVSLTDNTGGSIAGTLIKTEGINPVSFVNYATQNQPSTIVLRNGSGNFESNIVNLSLGSVTAPSHTFIGDTNTGMYSPSADILAFTAGGEQILSLVEDTNVKEINLVGSLVQQVVSVASTSAITRNAHIWHATASAIVLTLPTKPPTGTSFVIKNASGGNITVVRGGSNEFDQVPSILVTADTLTIPSFDSAEIYYFSNLWYFKSYLDGYVSS